MFKIYIYMGVNHGGDESPQNLQWGDANTGCPPRFLSFFKISSARHGFVPKISTQIYATVYIYSGVDVQDIQVSYTTTSISYFKTHVCLDHRSGLWTPCHLMIWKAGGRCYCGYRNRHYNRLYNEIRISLKYNSESTRYHRYT
jgi:hypothetical protein